MHAQARVLAKQRYTLGNLALPRQLRPNDNHRLGCWPGNRPEEPWDNEPQRSALKWRRLEWAAGSAKGMECLMGRDELPQGVPGANVADRRGSDQMDGIEKDPSWLTDERIREIKQGDDATRGELVALAGEVRLLRRAMQSESWRDKPPML